MLINRPRSLIVAPTYFTGSSYAEGFAVTDVIDRVDPRARHADDRLTRLLRWREGGQLDARYPANDPIRIFQAPLVGYFEVNLGVALALTLGAL